MFPDLGNSSLSGAHPACPPAPPSLGPAECERSEPEMLVWAHRALSSLLVEPLPPSWILPILEASVPPHSLLLSSGNPAVSCPSAHLQSPGHPWSCQLCLPKSILLLTTTTTTGPTAIASLRDDRDSLQLAILPSS